MTTPSTNRPRVLLLHNFLSPYRVPLFTELARRFDFEVWILGDVSRLREWSGSAPDAAFRYRLLPNWGLGFGSRYNRLLYNPGLLRSLTAHRCDVLICCGWDTPAVFEAAWWANRRGVPLVLWAGSTAAERTLLRRLLLLPVKSLVGRADAWIAYGSRAKSYLLDLGAGAEDTFCAFNTIETEEFARASQAVNAGERQSLRESLGIGTDHVVLFCGNLLALKGLDALFAGFAKFVSGRGDVTLLLVGSGAGEARYRGLAAKLGVDGRVIFAGYRDRSALPAIYSLADLLVLPSRSEVWGLVVNEALACGVPVLASEAVGASADLIEEGRNGYVVPVDSPDAIASALSRHFSNQTGRNSMREAARASIAPYTIGAMADAFEAAVERARAKHRK